MDDSTGRFRFLVHETLCSKHFVLFCFLSAFLLRICWISFVNPEPVSDFAVYYNTAVALSEGRGFLTVDGAPTASWPVGYPGFLSLLFMIFGPSIFAGKMANVVLYMGVLFLSYYLARKLFDSELTGRITLAILSFYPTHIAYCSLLGTEILSTFLLLLAVSLLIFAGSRVYMGLLSGPVFGAGCLVRPETFFVPAMLFSEGLTRRIREGMFKKHLALFLVAYASLLLTILPWEARIYHLFGTFSFVTTRGGMALFMGSNPYADGHSWNMEMTKVLGSTGSEVEIDARARAFALAYMRQHPLKIIGLLPAKFYHLYALDTSGAGWNEIGMRPMHKSLHMFFRGFGILSQAYYMAMMIAFFVAFLFLLGSKRYKDRFPRSSLVGLWLIVYFTAIGLAFIGNQRYHFRTMPWIAMYVGALATLYVAPHSSATSLCEEK